MVGFEAVDLANQFAEVAGGSIAFGSLLGFFGLAAECELHIVDVVALPVGVNDRRDGTLLGRPLLIVLDEAANIAPLPDLDTLASTAAGIGIQLVTVWQDMAQIHNRYGDRATTIVNNHRAKLALSGISDPRTLEYFSRLVGDTEITRASTTHDDTGKTSTTQATHQRRLAPDEALRQLPGGDGLLLYGHLPAVQLRLRPWYQQRSLRQPTPDASSRARRGPQPAHSNRGHG